MNDTNNKKSLNKDHKILAKNTIYNFLFTYSTYFSSLITSFIIARLITQDIWGTLIIATSYVATSSLILTFLPPGLSSSLNYYIPKYLALNKKSKLKSYIKVSIFIRIIAVLSTFLISLLIFLFFSNLFRLILNNYFHLLLILSPMIIINGLDKFFNEINRGLNLFNTVFILTIIKYGFYIGALLFCLIFLDIVQIEIIALINIISLLVPFLINCIIIYLNLRFKLKTTERVKVTYKKVIKNSSSYGIHIEIQNFFGKLFTNLRLQSVGIFEPHNIITGYNLAKHYKDVSTGSVGSLSRPLIISFSGFNARKQYDQIQKIYKILFKYTSFFLLLITGLLFFFTDFYLFLFTTENQNYMNYSLIFKLVIISVIFFFQRNFFFSLLKSSEKIKYLVPISLFFQLLNLILFFVGLIYFGIIGAILGGIIESIINFIFTTYLSFKYFRVKTDNLKTIFLLSSFFIAIGITLIMDNLVLKDLNYLILQALNLLLFKELNLFSIISFFFIFIFLIILFKIFTRSDIEYIDGLFEKKNFLHRSIRWGLNFLKKFTKE